MDHKDAHMRGIRFLCVLVLSFRHREAIVRTSAVTEAQPIFALGRAGFASMTLGEMCVAQEYVVFFFEGG
jgi:hypothetical protein